jgi:Glycosyl transferase family 2
MTTSPGTANPRHRVAVVVASIDARGTVGACVDRFAEEVRGRGEIVLVDASRDGTADLVERSRPGVRVIRESWGALGPELWRVGLRATDAPLVALSTAAMIPARGWLDAMLARLEETGASAVGGPIEPAAGLSATDGAVYLLRYVNYLRPLPELRASNNSLSPPYEGGVGGGALGVSEPKKATPPTPPS